MRLYSTHTRAPGAPPELIKEGFSWPCLVFGWLGLLLSGSWMAALLAGAVTLALIAVLLHLPGLWPIAAGSQVLLACFANDLRRWELRLRGFSPGPLVAGADADAAMLRLLDRAAASQAERA